MNKFFKFLLKGIIGKDRKTNKFVAFLENNLGDILCGWSEDEEGKEYPFQIVKFSKGPFEGTTTYATLGLSSHILSNGDKPDIRQELLMISDANFGDEHIPAILNQIGMSILQQHSALLRGEVIGPYGPLFEHSALEALYSSVPVYFPDEFHMYEADGEYPIIMTWLIPITSEEAAYVDFQGWEKFEDLLEQSDPNLVDFQRKSIVQVNQ